MSACIIARNEAHRLPGLLPPLRGVCDEVVVVDTGSEDGTERVARQLGARVVTYPWTESFSDARNMSLDQAAGPWIVCLDADDECPADTLAGIRRLKVHPPDRAFGFQVLSTQDGVTGPSSSQVRMFPKHPRVRFRYRVHEQIRPALADEGIPIYFTDLIIHHRGYTDRETVRAKQRRNLALLEKDLRERPADAYLRYMAAMALADLGRGHEARAELERAWNSSRCDGRMRHIALGSALQLAATALDEQGARPEAIEIWLDEAEALDGEHPQLLYLKGRFLMGIGRTEAGVSCLQRLMKCEAADPFLPVDMVMLKSQGAALLAQVLMEQGKTGEAVAVIEEAQRLLKGGSTKGL